MELKIQTIADTLFGSRFLSSSSVIFAGSFVVNVLNYVFTLLMSRLMGIEEFGELAAMLGLLLVISVPSTALTMLMTREAALRSTSETTAVRDLFLFLQKHVTVAALALWVVFIALIPPLSFFLHISFVTFLLFSVLIPLTAYGALQAGTLQGLQEFFMLSKQSVLSASIKLLVAILLVLAGFGVPGVMVALVLAQLASSIYGYFATRTKLGIEKASAVSSPDIRGIGASFGAILLTTLLLVLLSNIDVLLAKHFLPPLLAGEYGALSTVGKIVMYGVGAFTIVLLPMASAAHARGYGEEKHVLALSLLIIAAASLCACALFTLFPGFFVSVLFGARYLQIAANLGFFSVAIACIALSTALINYFVAIRNTSFMYLLSLAIVIEVALISLSHDTLGAITRMLVVSSVLLLLLMALNYVWAQRPRSL